MDHPPPSTCQENIRQPCHPNASWACCRLSSSSAWAVLMLASWQWKKMMRAKIRSPLTHHDRRYLWFPEIAALWITPKSFNMKHLCADLDGPSPASSCWTLKARALYSASCSYRSKWKLEGQLIGFPRNRSFRKVDRCYSSRHQWRVKEMSFAVPSNVRFHLWPCWCCRKFHLMSSSCGEGLRIGFSNALQADGVLGHLESGLNTPVVAATGKDMDKV